MDKVKISQEFLEAAFNLGKELIDKDDLTEVEQKFIVHLDKIADLINV